MTVNDQPLDTAAKVLTFAFNANPDYAFKVEEARAASRPLDVEALREFGAELATRTEPARDEVLPCPTCHDPLNVRQGRHSGAWFVTHSPARGCAFSGNLWRVNAGTREACVMEFGRLLEIEEGE